LAIWRVAGLGTTIVSSHEFLILVKAKVNRRNQDVIVSSIVDNGQNELSLSQSSGYLIHMATKIL
jgi:hypothetical protein